MGLLKIIKKTKAQERELRLLILGLDNAGKTTILKKFLGEDTSEIAPTLGFAIKTVEHNNFKLNFWDVGGQQTIRAYWRNYFEVTDGIIWVVDSSDKWRLDTCRDELAALLLDEQVMGASLLIFANKQDLPNALSGDAIAKHLNLGSEQYAKRHWSIMPCSAQTGEGLVEGIDWLVDDVDARVMMR